VTNRRTPAKRPTRSTTWKPGRARSEILKAVGAAAGVVVVTILLILILKPGDSGSSTGTVPATTQTVPSTDTVSTQSSAATTATQPPAATAPAQP
jgi:hypothetical protein